MRLKLKRRWPAWIAGSILAGVGVLAALSFGSGSTRGQTTAGCPAPPASTTATPTATMPFAVVIGGPCAGQTNQPVTLAASVQNAGPSQADLQFFWSFGDGGTASGNPVQHTYTSANSYPVQVSVVGNGRSATNATTINVIQGLTVKISVPSTGTVGQGLAFSATGTLPADTTFTWDFGDGGTGSGQSVAHLYTTTGTFNVTLTATSASTGRSGVDKTAVTIAAQSTSLNLAINGPSTATAGQAVTFAVSISGNAPQDVFYTWSFGDGTVMTAGQSVSHTYAQGGTYSVTVAAASASTGATGSAGTSIVVSAAAPTATPVPTGPSVTYLAGWNLVGGPTGQTFPQANGPLYTYQAGDVAYQALPNTSSIVAGRGYWAYFNTTTTVPLAASGTNAVSVTVPAGQYVMVGNPSQTQTVTVRGADVVYTFDPVSNSYTASNVLVPGRGAWVLIVNGGTVTIGA